MALCGGCSVAATPSDPATGRSGPASFTVSQSAVVTDAAAAQPEQILQNRNQPAAQATQREEPVQPGQSRQDTPAATALEISQDSGLQECMAYAALNNPGLRTAYHRWQAALEQVAQVRSLPNPSVSYRYYIESVETRVGPQQHAFGIRQTLPWLGKLARRGDVHSMAAAAAYQRYENEKLELFYRVRGLYYELYFLRSSIEITRDTVELLGQFERIARARYRVSATSHPDVIRVQVELGRPSGIDCRGSKTSADR